MNNKLTEEIEEIIYHLHLELEQNSCLVMCEEGESKFVSTGAVNGFVSRIKRALRDDGHRKGMLEKFKEN